MRGLDSTNAAANSGAIFETGAMSTPEPSTWAMLILGFAGLGYASFAQGEERAVRSIGRLIRRDQGLLKGRREAALFLGE